MMSFRYLLLFVTTILVVASCRSSDTDPLPPEEYVENALNWIQANSVKEDEVQWQEVRQEALAMASEAQTTADTYPAITYALAQLHDSLAFLWTPDKTPADLGILAVYPENIVIEVQDNSPGDKAGVQVGDVIETVNGKPPRPLEVGGRELSRVGFVELYADTPSSIEIQLRRDNEPTTVIVKPNKDNAESRPVSRQIPIEDLVAGYLDLPLDVGTEMYPTWAQEAMSAGDGPETCGWILDLRRNNGGDLWTYLAALGPLLGEGEVGGFVYRDGSEEMWYYRDGKVFWEDEERFESYVRGPILELARPAPAVAILIGPVTHAAGELVVVAFQGWGNVRTFGEATAGTPHLALNTPLSDEALLILSGAFGMDRTGKVYKGPIEPDEPVEIKWQKLSHDDDPAIQAALAWLADQPECN